VSFRNLFKQIKAEIKATTNSNRREENNYNAALQSNQEFWELRDKGAF